MTKKLIKITFFVLLFCIIYLIVSMYMDNYAIYNTVIDALMEKQMQTQDSIFQSSYTTVYIATHTAKQPIYMYGEEIFTLSQVLKQAQKDFPGLATETLRNFKEQNRNTMLLNKKLFKTKLKLLIVDENGLKDYYNDIEAYKEPETIGVFIFSRIGFNFWHTQAFVHVNLGTDHYLFLVKEKNKWIVKQGAGRLFGD